MQEDRAEAEREEDRALASDARRGAAEPSAPTRHELEERIRALEDALARSEERFSELFGAWRDGLAEVDVEGRYCSANRAFLELFGARTIGELDPEVQRAHAAAIAAAVAGGSVDERDREYRRADGSKLLVREELWVRRDRRGRPAGCWVRVRDVEPERRAEVDLRTMSRAVDQSPLSVVITDLHAAIQYVNPRFTEVTGYTAEEVLGRNPRVLQSGETRSATYRELWAKVTSGATWVGEFRNRKKSGELYWEAAQIAPIFEPDGRISGYVALKQDITEKKLLEEQLRQAQKMEAVGRLAGGVAHDFNNLLTVIRTASALLEREAPAGHPLRELVDEISVAGERATSLTRQLLAFSRRQVLEARVVDLPALVSDLGKMLRRLIGEDVELVMRSTPPVVPVEADPGQLEQVIINLAVNARDAMPSGGQLLIATSSVELSEHAAAPRGLHPGRHAVLEIADDGCGMTDEVLAHLFEPFFTTKELGKGTGLGLATVHGIVAQSGGHIEVESEPGRGTCFRIYLPAASSVTASARSQDLLYPPSSAGTVLLVEDDGAIRNLLRCVLRQHGFEVIPAANAREAIEVLERHRSPIRLVLTDVVMPGGSGVTIAAPLAAHHPEARLLYMSGYTGDALLQAGLEGQVAFIQKPFAPSALLAKIDELLA